MKKAAHLLACLIALYGQAAFAAANDDKSGRTQVPEDDDFSSTPFTQYGEFNQEQEEEEDTVFLQHGRLFGVSLGLGSEGVTGNRALLWQGGFPYIDFMLHYWFDFQVAIDLGVMSGSHNFFDSSGNSVDANLTRVGVDAKYYFDTKNLTAAISFANPYVSVGGGAFTKTQTLASSTTSTPDIDVGVGLTMGGGVEFAIKPGHVYLTIEGRYSIVRFKDTFNTTFAAQHIPDLTGDFFSFAGGLMYTW